MSDTVTPVVQPAPPPEPPPAAPPASPPPAATIVATSPISESSVQAQRELEEVNRKLKQSELRQSQLEDENRQLKAIPPNPIDVTANKQKRGFLDGWQPVIH